jgi:hypothetical protein
VLQVGPGSVESALQRVPVAGGVIHTVRVAAGPGTEQAQDVRS